MSDEEFTEADDARRVVWSAAHAWEQIPKEEQDRLNAEAAVKLKQMWDEADDQTRKMMVKDVGIDPVAEGWVDSWPD